MKDTSISKSRRYLRSCKITVTIPSCLGSGEQLRFSWLVCWLCPADVLCRHLGLTKELCPHARGFDKSFAYLAGVGNHWNNECVACTAGYHHVRLDADTIHKAAAWGLSFETASDYR